MTAPVPPPRGLRRSRRDGVLGGVCAGIAHAAGIDPLLARIAVVAVTLLTGGAGVLAYLAAWVLIPRETAPQEPTPQATTLPDVPTRPVPPGADSPGPPLPSSTAAGHETAPHDLRTAWSAVGDDLRSLAGELRRPAGTEPAPDTAATTPADADTDVPPPGSRSPLAAADDAATALGDRIRAPEVQAGARRVASSVSQAVTASVDEVGRKVRRDRG
jgi:phage shock protein PspC (stress-responsive transcriptional regulator)